MEHPYQDVIRGPPAECEPERTTRNAAIAIDADTNVGSQDHNVEPSGPSEAPISPEPHHQDLSRAQTQHCVDTLPQHGAALIDYALRDWNAITQGSTTTDGWVNRWFFDMYIVHFPSNFNGWAVVTELESSLPAVSHMQNYSDATEYRLCDWTRATDRATTGQRVCKHMFDALIAQCNPRIRRFQDTQVFPHENVVPSPERQPASPAHTHGPLSIRGSVTPSTHTGRERTPGPSHADGLESQRSIPARSQHGQGLSSRPSRGNVLYNDRAVELTGRRFRSRSPDLIARPRLDRDRDYPRARCQRDVSLHYSDGGRSSRGEPTRYPREDGQYHAAPSGIAPTTHDHNNQHPGEACHRQIAETSQNGTAEGLSPEPGHVVPHGSGLPDSEFKREKSEFSICCHCWTNNRPCDHQWPCRECRAKGKACAYIVCPMSNCSRDVKCPSYHIVPGIPKENRKLGSPMHLVALLGLNRRIIESYDVRKIRRKIEDPGSAQQIYLLLQKEIEQAVQALQPGKKFGDPAAKEVLRGSDKVPAMGDKALRYKASMIVKLVQQLRIQPYKELWRQFHRQQRFGPTARD
ncbi:hypothetical protein KCU71_g657, partial [Aureobasidium melanogenum]